MIYLISVLVLIGIILTLVCIPLAVGLFIVGFEEDYSFWEIYGIGLSAIMLFGVSVFLFLVILFKLVIPWVSIWGIK